MGVPEPPKEAALLPALPYLAFQASAPLVPPPASPAHKSPPPERPSYEAKAWKNSLHLDNFFCTSFGVSCTSNLWAHCWAPLSRLTGMASLWPSGCACWRDCQRICRQLPDGFQAGGKERAWESGPSAPRPASAARLHGGLGPASASSSGRTRGAGLILLTLTHSLS